MPNIYFLYYWSCIISFFKLFLIIFFFFLYHWNRKFLKSPLEEFAYLLRNSKLILLFLWIWLDKNVLVNGSIYVVMYSDRSKWWTRLLEFDSWDARNVSSFFLSSLMCQCISAAGVVQFFNVSFLVILLGQTFLDHSIWIDYSIPFCFICSKKLHLWWYKLRLARHIRQCVGESILSWEWEGRILGNYWEERRMFRCWCEMRSKEKQSNENWILVQWGQVSEA